MDTRHKEEVASDGQGGAGSNKKCILWSAVAVLLVIVAGVAGAVGGGAFQAVKEENERQEELNKLKGTPVYPPVAVAALELAADVAANVNNALGFEDGDGIQVTGGELVIPLPRDYNLKMNGLSARIEGSEIDGDEDGLFRFEDFSCNLPGMEKLGAIGMKVSEILKIIQNRRLRGLKELNVLYGLFRAGFKSLNELDDELRNFVNITNLQPIDDERLLFIRFIDVENLSEAFGRIAPEALESKAAKLFRVLFSMTPFQSTAVISLKRPMVLFSVAKMMGLKIPASLAITGPMPISLNLNMGLKDVFFGFSDPTDPNGIQVPLFNTYGPSLYGGIVQEQITTNSFMGGKFSIGANIGPPIPIPNLEELALVPKVTLSFSGKIATNTDFDEILGSSSFAETGNLADAGKWIKGFAGEGDVTVNFSIGQLFADGKDTGLIKKWKADKVKTGCQLLEASYQYRNDETLGDVVAISSTVNNALIQCPLDKLSPLLGLDKPEANVDVYMHLVEKSPSTQKAQVAMVVRAQTTIFSHTISDLTIKMETDVSDFENQKYKVEGQLNLGVFTRKFEATIEADSDSISFDGVYNANVPTHFVKYTTNYEIRTDGIFMGVNLEVCGKLTGICIRDYKEVTVDSANVQLCFSNSVLGNVCFDLY